MLIYFCLKRDNLGSKFVISVVVKPGRWVCWMSSDLIHLMWSELYNLKCMLNTRPPPSPVSPFVTQYFFLDRCELWTDKKNVSNHRRNSSCVNRLSGSPSVMPIWLTGDARGFHAAACMCRERIIHCTIVVNGLI